MCPQRRFVCPKSGQHVRTMNAIKPGINLTEKRASRHFRRRVSIFFWLATIIFVYLAGEANGQVNLSERDINEVIKFYKVEDSAGVDKAVKTFQAKMPGPVTSQKVREEILKNLPPVVIKAKIEDEKLIQDFRKLAGPVLKLYKRDEIYEIIIFRNKTPVMLSDTGIVLVVSSGLIEQVESDDELFGYLAHEVGHEFFASYSIYSRHLFKLINDGGREPFLIRKYAEALSLIELQCDAFSVLTLAHLNYNTSAFIEGFERTAKNFPDHKVGFHPNDFTRRKLVEGISLKASLNIKPKISSELKQLKELLVRTNPYR